LFVRLKTEVRDKMASKDEINSFLGGNFKDEFPQTKGD